MTPVLDFVNAVEPAHDRERGCHYIVVGVIEPVPAARLSGSSCCPRRAEGAYTDVQDWIDR